MNSHVKDTNGKHRFPPSSAFNNNSIMREEMNTNVHINLDFMRITGLRTSRFLNVLLKLNIIEYIIVK